MATSDNMASSELVDEGMSKEETFTTIMSILSEWYDKHESIIRLKVLYKDHICNACDLDRASTMQELFDLLISGGDLSQSDFTILYDTIKATEQYGIQSVITKKIPSFPNVKERKMSKLISSHRQRMMKFGMALTAEDVVKVSELYNDPVKEYIDSWDMIMDLEHRLIISEGKMDDFIKKLKTIQVPLAVETLTKGSEEDSGSIVFHLSVTDPNALENLYQISSSGELVRDLAELLVPEDMREDFIDKWSTEVDVSQYESALKKLKSHDKRDPYDICIISDDTDWEIKLKDDIKQKRPALNCSIMKKWRLSQPDSLQTLIAQSKKVIVAFSAKPLSEYSKYTAHSVIVEMLAEKTLTDDTVIAVKVTEDAVIPEEFKSFAAVNGWEEGLVDLVLQDFADSSSSGTS